MPLSPLSPITLIPSTFALGATPTTSLADVNPSPHATPATKVPCPLSSYGLTSPPTISSKCTIRFLGTDKSQCGFIPVSITHNVTPSPVSSFENFAIGYCENIPLEYAFSLFMTFSLFPPFMYFSLLPTLPTLRLLRPLSHLLQLPTLPSYFPFFSSKSESAKTVLCADTYSTSCILSRRIASPSPHFIPTDRING